MINPSAFFFFLDFLKCCKTAKLRRFFQGSSLNSNLREAKPDWPDRPFIRMRTRGNKDDAFQILWNVGFMAGVGYVHSRKLRKVHLFHAGNNDY